MLGRTFTCSLLMALATLRSIPIVAGQDQAKLARGQAIVEAKCARCHAIGRTGASPLDRAPPLRTIATRYPLENLAEALAEGIFTGHEEMPNFRFNPDEIDAILAYMDSVSPP